MTYEISVNLPNQNKGTEVEIPGLGVFKNGSTETLDSAQADAFRVYHATTEWDAENETWVSVNGPTVLQAQFPEGVSVTTKTKKGADE